MNTESINIEFVEQRIFRKDKVHFAFLKKGSIIGAVIAAFAEIKYPIRYKNEKIFNTEEIDSIQDDIMNLLAQRSEQIRERSIILKKEA